MISEATYEQADFNIRYTHRSQKKKNYLHVHTQWHHPHPSLCSNNGVVHIIVQRQSMHLHAAHRGVATLLFCCINTLEEVLYSTPHKAPPEQSDQHESPFCYWKALRNWECGRIQENAGDPDSLHSL